jgi:transposase
MGAGVDNRRAARAERIASRPENLEQLGETDWSVLSESGLSRYSVVLAEGVWVCECKDFEKRGQPCKHILRVLDLNRPSQLVSHAPRKQYTQHASYTRAQTEEMRLLDSLLRELVREVPDLPRALEKGGRPALPLSESLYCAILKVYSGLSGRRASGVYANVHDRDLLSRVPNYMVASRALNRPEATHILYRLLSLSAAPLAGLEEGGVIAPDSTGVQTTSFGGWREEKHGEKRHKKWLKVHAMVGTRTHVIIRAIVSEQNSGDAPEFEPLLRGAVEDGFRPSTVVADKGYLSANNYAIAGSLGIEPYIPFRAGTVSNEVNRIRGVRKPDAWVKAYHLFRASREEFDRNYHRRSNVESVFSALKRKLGENIRSRTSVAQVNEILCKLIAYNLTVVVHEIFENGIAPSFGRSKNEGFSEGVRGG